MTAYPPQNGKPREGQAGKFQSAAGLPFSPAVPGNWAPPPTTTAQALDQLAADVGGGAVVSVTGTAPIASSGGANPAISIAAATAGNAGSMSAADKAKLDGLPAAAVASVTGVAPIASSGGANPAISIAAATPALPGSMSAADKTKLNALPTNPVTAVTGTAPIASSGGATPAISITPATGAAAGSMSAADKAKLDAIPTGGASALIFNVTVPGGGSIPANTGQSLTVAVAGVLATDAVFANQTSATFAAGLSIVNAFASGANQVTLELMNCTTTSKAVPTNFPLRVGVLR